MRSLAGLIRNCGILRRDAVEMLKLGYELYRARSPGSHPRSEEAMPFRRTYANRTSFPSISLASGTPSGHWAIR